MAPQLGPAARIVVENRAGGSVGADWVRHRPADGYTLLLAGASALGTNPAALPEQTPYDPVEDFTAIALIGGGPMVLVVPAASPFRDLRSLLEAVRAKPYRGGSAVMEALAKGEVDYSLEVLVSVAPHMRDGRSRGLARAASALS